jgi:hypothetical protein
MIKHEELAHELLLGVPGPKGGREYPERNSKRERAARIALARMLWKEAPDGYFTRIVASLIHPKPRSRIVEREIIFQRRNRGTPVVVGEGRRAEVAAFMHKELEKQKLKWGKQNLKAVVGAAVDEFDIGRSTIMEIWGDYRPRKLSRKSPTK